MGLKGILGGRKGTSDARINQDAPPDAVEPAKRKSSSGPSDQIVDAKRPRTDATSANALTAPSVEARAKARGNLAQIMIDANVGLGHIEDASSLASLTSGANFGPRLAQSVKEVMGKPVTKEGLEKLYGAILPDAHVALSGVKQNGAGGSLEFTVNWMDNQGNLVAKINRRMARHEGGAVELYSHGCWVEPSHRSRAVSAAVMRQETRLMASLSEHPATRLSLWAGGMRDPNNPEDFQPIGVYVWATMGFDCAQNHGRRSRLPRGGAMRKRCELETKDHYETPDFDFMKQVFEAWVDRATERGELPEDPEIQDGLKQAAHLCDNMWSLATLDVPGVQVDVTLGGRKSACHIGKAFLLSDEAPRWEGVFYVNRNPETFAQIAQEYCEPRIEKAVSAFEARQTELAAVLDHGDMEAKQDALREVGRSGDMRWKPILDELIAEEPELADFARDALRHVIGDRLTEALGERAADSTVGVNMRLSAMNTCLARDPTRREAVLTNIIEQARTGSDFEVAGTALDRLTRGEVDSDRLLELVEGLYRRALGDKVHDPVGEQGRGRSHFSKAIDMRKQAVRELSRIGSPAAQDLLLEIAKSDPYWEVAHEALDDWVRVGGALDPGKALDQVVAFLERARGRHAELKREKEAGGDGARRASDLMNRLAGVRRQTIQTLARLDGPEVAEELEASLQREPYWDSVGAALEGLAKVVGEQDPKRVMDRALHWHRQAANFGRMRSTCLKVLDRLGTPAARAALVDLANKENDRGVLDELAYLLRDLDAPGADAAYERVEALREQFRAEAKTRSAARKW